jgi:hypothetical protein
MRRTLATIQKQWPEVQPIPVIPPTTFEYYFQEEDRLKLFLNSAVGEVSRLIEYPKLGYTVPQEISENVIDAHQKLIELGYNKYLVKG